MKLGIMQPYLFPYIGYFQLMNAVDEFVIYDNIQFSKAGWFHRNRILINGEPKMFSLPLKRDSDFLDVRDRRLAEDRNQSIQKILNQMQNAYHKAPHFSDVYPLVKAALSNQERNLFAFLFHSISLLRDYIGIHTPMLVSSEIPIDHNLRAEKKVIALCKARHADIYVNPIGGIELYSNISFRSEGITLQFLRMKPIKYQQFGYEFVPFLSIIDVMMFNSVGKIVAMLSQYDPEANDTGLELSEHGQTRND